MKQIFTATYILFFVFLTSSIDAQILKNNNPNRIAQQRGTLAIPDFIMFEQSDSSSISVHPYGDAILNWAQTKDGYTLLHNSIGDLVYAIKDANNYLIPSEVIAHEAVDRNEFENRYCQTLEKGLIFSEEQKVVLKAAHQFSRNRSDRNPGSYPTSGTPSLLVIFANFSDTNPVFTPSQLTPPLTQAGYNSTGCIKEYFYEASFGQLDLQITILNTWVTVPQNHDYYAPDTKWGEFAFDAITAADPGVDYSAYDNDSDGIVEAVSIIHQGAGSESSYSANDIWSHTWSLAEAGYNQSQRTFDGVVLDYYTCTPEDDATGNLFTIGIMCHEIGHLLGAPDFYDTDYTAPDYRGTGFWDLQADGFWNGSPWGVSPAHPNLFTKIYYYNWLEAVELNSPITINMVQTDWHQQAYYYTTTNTNEFFLIENQQQVGFDVGLPGAGLLIYHVDQDYIDAHFTNNDINASAHLGLSFEDAGNDGDIDDDDCPFPGTSGNFSFTDITSPSSINWTGGQTNKPITNIAGNYTMMSFDFMGGSGCIPPPLQCSDLQATSISDNSITLQWTRGMGEKVLVLAKQDNPISTEPIGTMLYMDHPDFGLGDGPEPECHAVFYADGDQCIINALNPGTEYHFALYEAFSMNNCYRLPGLTGSFTTTGTSSNESLNKEETFMIRLSEDKSKLLLQEKANFQDFQFKIFSTDSKIMIEGENQTEIDIHKLQSGLYVVLIQTSDNKRTSRKFVLP